MKKQRICRIGAGVAIAIMSFQALPAWSQPDYQIPDGRRVDCSDQGPLDRYKATQQDEIRKLQSARDRRENLKTTAETDLKNAEAQHTEAANKVGELDRQIGKKEGELNRAQGDEKRRLEKELDGLRTSKIEWSAKRNKAFEDEQAAETKLKGIEEQIKDIDAQLARYEGRKTAADASYKEHCKTCPSPFAWNPLNQKCECALSCNSLATPFEDLDRASCKCVCDQCCQNRRKGLNCGGQSR